MMDWLRDTFPGPLFMILVFGGAFLIVWSVSLFIRGVRWVLGMPPKEPIADVGAMRRHMRDDYVAAKDREKAASALYAANIDESANAMIAMADAHNADDRAAYQAAVAAWGKAHADRPALAAAYEAARNAVREADLEAARAKAVYVPRRQAIAADDEPTEEEMLAHLYAMQAMGMWYQNHHR